MVLTPIDLKTKDRPYTSCDPWMSKDDLMNELNRLLTILFDQYAGKSVPRYLDILEVFLPMLRHSTKDSSMDFESLMIKDNEKLKKSADTTSISEDQSVDIGEKVNPLESFGWTVESSTFPYFTALLIKLSIT